MDRAEHYAELRYPPVWVDDKDKGRPFDINWKERQACIDGYTIAAKEFALTWIDFNKQKPPHGVPVLAYHHLWVNEDFNPTGIREGFLMDNLAADSDRCKIDFCSAYWWDYQDCYMTISKANIEGHEQEYSQEIRDSIFPEYWLPIPKFIKPE